MKLSSEYKHLRMDFPIIEKLTGMNSFMLGQIPLLRERFITNVTLIRLLSVMPTDMQSQRSLVGKSLGALRTVVLFLPGMRRHVIQ